MQIHEHTFVLVGYNKENLNLCATGGVRLCIRAHTFVMWSKKGDLNLGATGGIRLRRVSIVYKI